MVVSLKYKLLLSSCTPQQQTYPSGPHLENLSRGGHTNFKSFFEGGATTFMCIPQCA